jgi:hypothetical protein
MFAIIRSSFIGLLFVLIFWSCKNDLKIVAPYKEIPSVYAIITPQERIQMIRINKVFLGEGDAKQMAKVPDSVNYKSGELTVMLERYVNGSKSAAEQDSGKTEVYFSDSLIQTNAGDFTTTQRVYISRKKLFSNGIYKLTIKNNRTGNSFTSQTNALDSVGLSGLPPFAAPFYPVPYASSNPPYYYIDYSNPNGTYNVRTKPTNGGYLHDLTIRIHYYDSLSNGSKYYQMLDYVFNPQQQYQLQDLNNSKYFNFTFTGSSLFLELGNMLAKRPFPFGLVGRKAYRVDFISYATTQDYYDYLQFAAPSLSFAQEKLLYSNFENRAALGLFTFRTRCQIAKDMATLFVDQFAYNKNTCTYRFYTSNLSLPGCP